MGSDDAMTRSFRQPAVTVDIIIFAILRERLKVLLIKRRNPPFQGRWALPGGFIDVGESPEAAARRELEEETGIRTTRLHQLHTFGDPGRDPRGHTISIVYYAVVRPERIAPRAASDASAVGWFSAFHPPPLAFDHRKILRCGVRRLQHQLQWTPLAFDFLPARFTLDHLSRVYQCVMGCDYDARALRKKIRAWGQLVPAARQLDEKTGRWVTLYRFRRRGARASSLCRS